MKAVKTILICLTAAFFSLVFVDNIIDYNVNWQFVHHVLAMDTIFKGSVLKVRALENEVVQKLFYWIIILTEGAIALICWVGAWGMAISSNREEFKRSKQVATLGLLVGIILWFFAFIVIGGEWFAMWQSHKWNGYDKAALLTIILLLILNVVSSSHNELN